MTDFWSWLASAWSYWTSPQLLHQNVVNFAGGMGLSQALDTFAAIFGTLFAVIVSVAPYLGTILMITFIAKLAQAVMEGDPAVFFDFIMQIVSVASHLAGMTQAGLTWIVGLLGIV